jgi:hypothetical protein
MRELQTAEEVAAELAGATRIGVDGIDGSGKSTLGKRLGDLMGLAVLGLDEFLEREQGGFVEHIRYKDLRARVSNEPKFVIEGVCLREVLDRAHIAVDKHIYVKRYAHGIWADERELDLNEPLEEFLEQERELTSRIAGEKIEHLGLGEEIIRYHFHRRPFRTADVIFKRNDS